MKGHVKWFNSQKGWGFLTRDDGGGDVFIHYSKITMQGFRTLKQGDEVEFDLEESDKGSIATNVRLVNSAE